MLSAVLAGGAFAAFLSTASGLTISVAGVIDQDFLARTIGRRAGGDVPRIRTFRLAAVVAVVVPYAASWLAVNTSLADTVGLAFAVAASTFCPLLVLGVWWRRLSVAGATAGLVTGGVLALTATTITVLGGPGSVGGGWLGALLAQPAAWTVPTAFLVAVLVSYATPGSVPGRHLPDHGAPARPRGPASRGATGPRATDPPDPARGRATVRRSRTTARRGVASRWATALPTRRASSSPRRPMGRGWPSHGWRPAPVRACPTNGGVAVSSDALDREVDTSDAGSRYAEVQQSTEYKELRRRFRRFVFPMTALFLAWYFLYVLLSSFAVDFMSTKVFGEINVGLILGLLQFVSTFAITIIYVRWADRHFDPAAEALRERVEGSVS